MERIAVDIDAGHLVVADLDPLGVTAAVEFASHRQPVLVVVDAIQEMHDVRVINPLCHLLQQPVVPDVVEVGSQVKVENARLPLDYCVGYSLDRVMCCPLGPVSKRSRLEIRLEDRLEDELERTLHHPVPDRRHGPVRLHYWPNDLWDRRRSPIPFILYTDRPFGF
jgi:hypothetical protein